MLLLSYVLLGLAAIAIAYTLNHSTESATEVVPIPVKVRD